MNQFVAVGAILVAMTASRLMAGDWPQILGPERNGVAKGERLAAWPKGGPQTVWQRQVGRGFAGVAVAAGKLIVFHRLRSEEVAECLEAASGKPLWKQSFPTDYVSTIAPDDGPRCVPLIQDDRVYLFGAGGRLAALSLGDGKTLWSHDCRKQFQAPEGYFGAGSSPILEKGKLLVNVGGDRAGAGIVAFDAASGRVLWKATNEQASYSSPVAATVDGVRHVLFATRLTALSVDPENGQVRFRFPFGARGPTVNAANPVVLDGHVFLTASYGVGAAWAKIGKSDAETIWTNDDTMSSQYTTPVPLEGLLYGIDGRQDVGVAALRCIDPRTGKVVWTQEGFGTATLILAGDKLLIVKSDGELVLAVATPRGYQPLATASISSGTVRALPALSDGKLYVRDETMLKCLAMPGEPAAK